MGKARRASTVTIVSVLLVGLMGSAAFAVDDPLVPGDECSASTQAVGHPAFFNQQDNPQGAIPPFSANNPGKSTGAQGSAHSEAAAHCTTA